MEFDSQATGISCFCVSVFEIDALDEGERVLDLIAGRVVIDVVGHTSFIGRVENY